MSALEGSIRTPLGRTDFRPYDWTRSRLDFAGTGRLTRQHRAAFEAVACLLSWQFLTSRSFLEKNMGAELARLFQRKPSVNGRIPACILFFGGILLLGIQTAPALADQPIKITVDARDILRRVVTSKIVLPAKPGAMTLHFPKWIPGTHGPFGPVTKLAGIKLTANGQPLPWKRDSDDMFAFHCDVSENVAAIEAELLYVVAARADYLEVSLGVVASKHMAILNWNALLLYPGDAEQAKVEYQAKLLLPEGWKAASSLAVASQSAGAIDYSP